MSSNNLSLEDSGSLDISSNLISDKETQTSSTYITDSFDLVKGPSRPLPKGYDKTDIELPLNNILDRRVIKDSATESTSTDLVSETVVKEIVNPSVSSDEVSTSLKYCKEVIEPYLKTPLNDCEDNAESLEQYIQDALNDLPDYQPCFEVSEGKKDIEEKINTNPTLKMGSKPNLYNDKENTRNTNRTTEKNIDDTYQVKSQENNINIIKEGKAEEVHVHGSKLQKEISDQNQPKDVNTSKSTKSIAECAKNSLTAIKRSGSSCINKIENPFGIKKSEDVEEKPSYYTREIPNLNNSPAQNVQTETGNSLKNLLNNSTDKITIFTEACKNFAENLISNPNEKMCAIKDTCRDFAENLLNNPDEKVNSIKETCKDYADKLYKTSKDAVSLLSSESAKLLTKISTDLNSDDDSHNIKKEKTACNISADSVTRFLFQKAENKPAIDGPEKEEAATGPSRINETIAPAIKQSFCRIRDDIVSSKFDKSSPYDKPLPKEALNKLRDRPETKIPTVSAIDQPPDPPSSSNMFAIIRSKIFSIFRDETEKPAEPVIQEKQDDDDEEEDDIERFMEQ